MKKTRVMMGMLVLIFLLATACLKPREVPMISIDESINMYVVADPHYMSEKLTEDCETFTNYLDTVDRMMKYTGVFLDIMEVEIKKNQPDIIVFPGDLTNNGSKVNHLEFEKRLKRMKSTGAKVYVVPGNHDINNTKALYFKDNELHLTESINEDEFVEIYKNYGYGEAISRDKNTLSYLAKPYKNLWLLMLDTTKDYPEPGGYLNRDTLNWIVSCSDMAKEENAEIIVVMHHNLLDHSDIIWEDYTVDNNTSVLNTFHEIGIKVVLSGHIHIQDIKSHTSIETGNTIYDIATSSLPVYNHQYGQLSYSPSKGYDYETRKLDVEKYALENNLEDENLLSFNDYSEKFFIKNLCRKHKESIELLDLSDEEKQEVFKTVVEMNKKYFSGYRNEALQEQIESEGFKIVESLEECFIQEYVMGMIDDQNADNNKLHIPIN
ncbi:MAG TPA: metallophosphoesterase [Sedimentibacter sp.]|nr:metallophosphoesterase [Sedimentibacter sp.]HOK49080.1 metallophosphoesterase [Sedimentibacter sp.]HOW23113.1 metallophosphoesterase [Sedimentibacter sp.]